MLTAQRDEDHCRPATMVSVATGFGSVYPSTVEPGWMDLSVCLQLVVGEVGDAPRGVANGETPDRRVIRRGSSVVVKKI